MIASHGLNYTFCCKHIEFISNLLTAYRNVYSSVSIVDFLSSNVHIATISTVLGMIALLHGFVAYSGPSTIKIVSFDAAPYAYRDPVTKKVTRLYIEIAREALHRRAPIWVVRYCKSRAKLWRLAEHR